MRSGVEMRRGGELMGDDTRVHATSDVSVSGRLMPMDDVRPMKRRTDTGDCARLECAVRGGVPAPSVLGVPVTAVLWVFATNTGSSSSSSDTRRTRALELGELLCFGVAGTAVMAAVFAGTE